MLLFSGFRLSHIKDVFCPRRAFVILILSLCSFYVYSDQCENIIALSKVVDVVVSDRATVQQHASNFCNECARHRKNGSHFATESSYKFLATTLRKRDVSYDDVASKYCSASTDYEANQNVYKQYTELISPNAYDAYASCIEMAADGLKFDVSAASVLPQEFSLSVSFFSISADDQEAHISVTTSSDVVCNWHATSQEVKTMVSGSTSVLQCQREDPTKRSYVRITRTDKSMGEFVFPWPAYDGAGHPVDALAALQSRISEISGAMADLGQAAANNKRNVQDLNHRLGNMRIRIVHWDSWDQENPTTKTLIRSDEGVCFLTMVRGKFEGGREWLKVYEKDGYWYLAGESHQEGVMAEATCVRFM